MSDSGHFGGRIIQSLGADEGRKRPYSFAFKSFVIPQSWRTFTYELPFPLFFIASPNAKYGEMRSFVSEIKLDIFMIIFDTGTLAYIFIKRGRKGEHVLPIAVRTDEDSERVERILKKFTFTGNMLVAHSNLSQAFDQLREGAEKDFLNRGLFSNHFLKERLFDTISKRGRKPEKEAAKIYEAFGGNLPVDAESALKMLSALGFMPVSTDDGGHAQYLLRSDSLKLNVACVVASAASLDVKSGDKPVPAYQAISLLSSNQWVILTNGRLWRLYSSRVLSSSTNYFEVDIEGIASEGDQRLLYFVSIFSASAFRADPEGIADLDAIYDGGIKYAKEIEDELRKKVFEEKLFLNLAKSILDHSASTKFDQQTLDQAKELSLKLLYRLLFILYAESRSLLPINCKKYQEISMEGLRSRLNAMEKEQDSDSAWRSIKILFKVVRMGSEKAGVPGSNVPEYDGELFAESELDGLTLKNKYLVPALRDLCESDGKGIDYQNLGVRHLGSLYEALLEYSIRQADNDLIVYNGEILDGSFAADLKSKTENFIQKGELYLSVGGLARKGTGSYYTPDALVRYLARKGLEQHFAAREGIFRKDMQALKDKPGDPSLEAKTTDDILGLKVIDPAMGSGHFLVAVVDEITNWAISLLRQFPDAPLVKGIEEDRAQILSEQRKNGIILDESILTDSIILKRMVMKRCVYGIDINPLAVELAKLSLWLDSFTIGTPLTFLDHHIRCGDSLMGLWRDSIKDRSQESLESYIHDRGEEATQGICVSADLTLEERKRSRESYNNLREKTATTRIFLNSKVASVLEPESARDLPQYLTLLEENYFKPEARAFRWWKPTNDANSLAEKFHAFHWEYEFPDAYLPGREGFDLVIMNPPWDAVKPEDDDFFSVYSRRFRRISSKPEKKKEMKKLLEDAAIANAYADYRKAIERKLRFYKSEEYAKRGSGDTNLWKLFLERGLKATASNGSLAVIVPSGIVTDEGGKPLREALFKGRIRLLYEFENAMGIFPDVHRSYKFALLVWDKSSPTEAFPSAFYLHDIESLNGKKEQEKFIQMPMSLVKQCAPDSLSIPELRNNDYLSIFAKLYQNHPLLGDPSKGWTVSLIRELDRTNDSKLFRIDGKGWPLIEGKHFHQFIPDYEKTTFTVDPKEGLEKAKKHKEYQQNVEYAHELPRLAFRGVASSTNVRAMICCIIPEHCFFSNSAAIVHPLISQKMPQEKTYINIISYLCGIMNSFVFDYIIRQRISMNLNFFYVYQTPIPHYSNINKNVIKIINFSKRLSFTDSRFKQSARLLDEKNVEISMQERIDLMAQLNALVALHYSLNKHEYETIVNSFDGFEVDPKLKTLEGEIKWTDTLIRKLNGEVRKLSLKYFDDYSKGVIAV